MEDGYILNNIDKISNLPAVIVQGRHDVICPPHSASDLAKAWPGADFKMIDEAGHSALEPGILSALLSGLSRIAVHLGK